MHSTYPQDRPANRAARIRWGSMAQNTLPSRRRLQALLALMAILGSILLACASAHAVSTDSSHEHGDCAAVCCSHDRPSVDLSTTAQPHAVAVLPERLSDAYCAPGSVIEAAPAETVPRSRGGPSLLQVFLT